ncbi:hypothetical protein Bra5_CH02787 [Rhizobium phaseoli Brasil 5]|nr:hypothetical protein Bra5_CH02787 [Rhizobium phaseoli Brasil 5]
MHRQSFEQVVAHHHPPSKSTTQQNHNPSTSATKHSQALRRAGRRPEPRRTCSNAAPCRHQRLAHPPRPSRPLRGTSG